MRRFKYLEIEAAIAYSLSGGQALHLHRVIVDRAKAPACFVREVDAGRQIAHLFDQDENRLRETARSLGVSVILVERRGGRGQHIDLCGRPLRRAIAMCEMDERSDPDRLLLAGLE